MGKFREISTKLWSLVDVRNSFWLSINEFLSNFLQILHNI